MTLAAARAAAADAIETAAPAGALARPPYQVDGLSEATISTLARNLRDTKDDSGSGIGPGIVAVSAPARSKGGGIEIRAITLTLDRVALVGGAGLRLVDVVENALRGLPGAVLPALEPMTEPLRAAEKSAIHMWGTTVTWPLPQHEDVSDASGGMLAIREHFAASIASALGLDAATDDGRWRSGEIERDMREAWWRGLAPRAGIKLETQRESLGGAPDLAVVTAQKWTDDQDVGWSARIAEQLVVVTVSLWHRTEPLADEAMVGIMAALDQSVVIWPGDFDARVVSGTDVVTERRTGGQYEQDVDLIARNPAVWDDEQGLARAELQASVQSVTQLQPATRRMTGVPLDHEGSLRFPTA